VCAVVIEVEACHSRRPRLIQYGGVQEVVWRGGHTIGDDIGKAETCCLRFVFRRGSRREVKERGSRQGVRSRTESRKVSAWLYVRRVLPTKSLYSSLLPRKKMRPAVCQRVL